MDEWKQMWMETSSIAGEALDRVPYAAAMPSAEAKLAATQGALASEAANAALTTSGEAATTATSVQSQVANIRNMLYNSAKARSWELSKVVIVPPTFAQQAPKDLAKGSTVGPTAHVAASSNVGVARTAKWAIDAFKKHQAQ